jgi:hypothetical protein
MKESLLVMGCVMILFKGAYSQNSVDSVIRKFLIDKDQMDTAINTKVKIKEGGFLKKTNYFSEKKPAIHLADSITLEPVIFGCYKSHAPKFLLIAYKTDTQTHFYIYGADRLLQELNRLHKEILEGVKTSWNDEDAAALINYLSICYL